MRGIVKIYKTVLLVLLKLVFLCVGLFIGIFFAKENRLRAGTACMSAWAGWTCSILGIRVRRTGAHRVPPGSFVVANHCSYLDILVLGRLFPAVFVAKKDVESWFLIGPLARFAGTVFVNRNSKMETKSAMEEISNRLSSGISVILFPEGTTNNGMDMLAFKSSFFKVPVERNCPVLPVSLIYSHIDDKPVGEDEKDCVAWYGDMDLGPHLWNVLGMKRIDVRVHCNPVIRAVMAPDASKTRKLISSTAYDCVRAGCETLTVEATGNR